MRYRNVSNHIEDLDDGRVIEPGGYVELDDDATDADHNKRLIEEGQLIEAPEAPDVQAILPSKNAAKTEWLSVAEALSIDVPEDATRDEVVALVEKGVKK
jgi:hypothetical protein